MRLTRGIFNKKFMSLLLRWHSHSLGDNSDNITASCDVSSSMESFADFNMRWELCKFRKLGLDKKDKRKSTALQIEQYLCKDMVSLGSVLVKRMCFGYLELLRFEVRYRLRRSVAVDCLSCFNMHRLRIWLRVIRPCRWYYWLCQKNQHSIIRFYAKRNQLFWWSCQVLKIRLRHGWKFCYWC